MKKIPTDAFDYYFSLGPARSYQQVADHYGVTKRAVTALAKREGWQARLAEIERETEARLKEKRVDVSQAAREQHLKALRMVLGKGLEGLRGMTIDSPSDAIRAIGLAVREIRVELGEPSDRTAISIEDTIKREYERWMVVEEPVRDQDTDEEVGNDDEAGRRGGAS